MANSHDGGDSALSKKSKGTILVRVPDVLRERMKYWADHHGMSLNQYAIEAFERAIMRENLDYEVPALTIQRINELVESNKSLKISVENNMTNNETNFALMLNLVRGPNNYLNQDDGELE